MPRRRLTFAASLLSLLVLSGQLILPAPIAAETCALKRFTVELDLFNFVTGGDAKSRYKIQGTMCWNGTISWPGTGDPTLTFISGSRAGVEQKGNFRSADGRMSEDWVNLRYTLSCPGFPFPTLHYVWWYPRIDTYETGYTVYRKGSVDYGGAACITATATIISY